MKRNIYWISMAMIALVSCNNDEVVQINNGQNIEFRTALDTRATELTASGLGEFYVTALTDAGENYFTDIEFSDGDGDNSFTSEKDYYWPASGNLNFYAYYPSATDLGAAISINSTAKTLTDYAPAADIAEQKDFVMAKTVGSKAENAAGVALVFNHQLSQIEIKGKNENVGYVIKVKGVKIVNAAESGTFYFALSKWVASEELTTYGPIEYKKVDETDEIQEIDAPLTLTANAQSLMGGKGNAMLIPQNRPAWVADTETDGSYVAFLVQAETATGVRVFPTEEGEDYDWVAKPIAFDWAGGYKYTYTFDFSDGIGITDPENPENPGEEIYGGKISVDVTFDSWSSKQQSTDTLTM